MDFRWTPCLLLLAALANAASAEPPGRFRAEDQLPDALQSVEPGEVRLNGWLGERVANNAKNRLLAVEEDPMLDGFRHRPGKHPWIGEHVGKFLHAATLAWANSGDPALREKIDRVVAELIKTQEADGYLGTYVPEQRFGQFRGADWDVWSHKYCLMGLLTYYRYTGNEPALAASRKAGDLLINTFGPGKKSILSAGTHVGMAATSVLEPVVLLYRASGDERYLDFGRYIVNSWDEPNGPKIVATLLAEKKVSKTANSKAYEMLSNLVGLCELARATGERRYLEPAINAWDDIVANRLYITGSASQGEHFRDDHDLPNHTAAHVAETCVTVTWIQLNAQLLRLTGQARYGDELERTFYNHLAAAQRPDGAEWCYFTALEGTKPYGPGINCCVSSGPRGMALVPTVAAFKYKAGDADGLALNLFEVAEIKAQLGGQSVTVEQQSDFPRVGRTLVRFKMDRPARFGFKIRAPAWAEGFELRADDASAAVQDGWATLPPREWKNGDAARVSFRVQGHMVLGEHTNAGRAALTWGPVVLAYDAALNPGLPTPGALALTKAAEEPPVAVQAGEGNRLRFVARVNSAKEGAPREAVFVPFADAGASGSQYRVWLRAPGSPLPKNESLFGFAAESRSRPGNLDGSICDNDTSTFAVTFDATKLAQDWFAVSLDEPVAIRRVVFAHGKTFHDGGWFDATAGKPLLQLQATRGGDWKTIRPLDDYPATTSTDSRGLKDGQSFTLKLNEPVRAVAIRIQGVPAGGDNPKQAFSSCAELQAFGE